MPITRQVQIAKALLKIGAVGFKPDAPITFKSGIKSPVYIDNRRFPFYPKEWALVIEGFKEIIQKEKIKFDVIAGIETAGIPHSATLGFFLKKPSLFVRKQVKDHGTKKRVEGGSVEGKTVLLIEDHISTGGSSLSGVEALRNEGGTVNDCLAITSYEFTSSNDGFRQANVQLRTLTSFQVILDEALKQKKFTKPEMKVIQDWLTDPQNWAKKYGFGE